MAAIARERDFTKDALPNDRKAFVPRALKLSCGMADLTTIRNIGPAMAQAFRSAGVTTAEELRELGAENAYRRLLENGEKPHFIAFYAMAMGLQGRPWNDCQGQEKVALRARFDGLVASTKPKEVSGLARALDEVGVRIND